VELVEAIILSVLAASTPLLIAATGELVTERSGVLNLGVEGMMIMGAACGFAGAHLTGSTFIGALAGIAAGAALAAVFASATRFARARSCRAKRPRVPLPGSFWERDRRSGRDAVAPGRQGEGPPGPTPPPASARRSPCAPRPPARGRGRPGTTPPTRSPARRK